MKNNPLIPYVLIMAFGIGLIFFMSVGSGGQKDHAEEGGETTGTESTVDVSSCVSCHGGDLTGGMGPSLIGLEPDHIVDVLVNGLEGSNFMKPGMKSEAEAQAIAEHIATLE
ncbi:MAG: cytochrome c [Solibacillus sp.]